MNAFTGPVTSQKIGIRAVDFLLLADAGAFRDFARTELIEGEIWAVNAVHSWHARTTADLVFELQLAVRALNGPLRVFDAGSILLSDRSVPEPDISIAEDNDEGVLPLAKLKLAIEVSDTTAATDLGVKLRLYASAGVPEYWVVERDTRVVHQFWSPSGETYVERRTRPFGERIEAAMLAGVAADTSALR